MKKFVQILYNKAHWIFESETIPQFSDDIEIIEITGLNIEEGWDYERSTGNFYEPVIPIAPEPQKTTEEIAIEIQEKQARDTLIKFDGIASLYEDLQDNDLVKFEAFATLLEMMMSLEEKIDSMGGN